jgi:peptide/nickel transport system substrate-binding protein
MGQVQALQNGEVDLISPQSTADVLTALKAIDGLTVETNVEGTYEHVDLQQGNGGPFDPATYGGDAEKAHKVREAFLKTIPREKIVSDLIVPLNPDATVRNSVVMGRIGPGAVVDGCVVGADASVADGEQVSGERRPAPQP